MKIAGVELGHTAESPIYYGFATSHSQVAARVILACISTKLRLETLAVFARVTLAFVNVYIADSTSVAGHARTLVRVNNHFLASIIRARA
jgi:hypothetical protein